MVRSGTITKHGVISTAFPVAVSGVPRMRCQTHERSFHVLHPLVYEALPADTVIQPELVVLTEDIVLLKGAYLTLGTQVGVQMLDACEHCSINFKFLVCVLISCAQLSSRIHRPWTQPTSRRWRP